MLDKFIVDLFYSTRFSFSGALLFGLFAIFFPLIYLIYRCYHGLKKDNKTI